MFTLVFFVMSVTAASVSAGSTDDAKKWNEEKTKWDKEKVTWGKEKKKCEEEKRKH